MKLHPIFISLIILAGTLTFISVTLRTLPQKLYWPVIENAYVAFRSPMWQQSYGFGVGPLGKEFFLQTKTNGYSDERTLSLQIDLQPDTEYQLILLGSRFISTDGWPLRNTLDHFKTKAEK